MKTFIALMLMSSSVFAAELRCTLTEGENQTRKNIEITNDSMTEANFGKRGSVTVTGTAVYDLVNVYFKMNGTTFGASGRNSATIDMFPEGKEPVSLSCRIWEEPIGC